MSTLPKPPAAYSDFIERYPELGNAWELIGQAGGDGPPGERPSSRSTAPVGGLRCAHLVVYGAAGGAGQDQGAYASGIPQGKANRRPAAHGLSDDG